ncbi:MAG: cadmium-translocating P-type ATPase [Alphaproteobacteria bacterium]|nr:cadmium-translocating P-type ATPase [Alphaproteobacteria bacterium]MBU0797167.1 cadmium-translocating P-type ATPase [Alphaproteobacteria bacterium]MBU0887162.1 cadmium-translocating P-type ATPase [Alphaproteobacteria bacterium]MBU1814412.1 cadmium-translocating P-type ATPase [Alphaproteobacteria bacterium]MBU2089235.1 cadmium-translocating P-type ATPase [Alphaproteobacteria bacterium]
MGVMTTHTTDCEHCGQPTGLGAFCCSGCEMAHAMINRLGLGRYYDRRTLDPALAAPKPDTPAMDFSALAVPAGDGIQRLHLMVEGLHCAACVWLIEAVLAQQPGVVAARLNMTTRRLRLEWRAGEATANDLVGAIQALGYRVMPYDPVRLADQRSQGGRALLRALAVAGFAAGNVMLLSVAIWAGHAQDMGPATRDLLHWVSALIALPAIAFAGQVFFRSAWTALRARRTNMDVPISIGVILAAGMSLLETMQGGPHAYFDSAITLLFFLLIGRYLDARARGRVRGAAEHLLALQSGAVSVLAEDGSVRLLPARQVQPGMRALIARGERLCVDGIVRQGRSDIDTALITGESLPRLAEPGLQLHAGTLNLTAPLTVEVTAVGEGTLLAEIVRLTEVAEQGRAAHVALADRVSRRYAPVVHLLALITFLGWVTLGGMAWQPALMIAVAVLIITCPCALALAVPAVQVLASGRLMRQGILLKSATALERLTGIDRVVFDKTGTLTLGRPVLLDIGDIPDDALTLAASLAAASRHPLAQALAQAAPPVPALPGVTEVAGCGLECGSIRLGSRRWLGLDAAEDSATGPELWLSRPGAAPVRFRFTDRLKIDAGDVVARLQARGIKVSLLSGDRAAVVAGVAAAVGIIDFQAECLPEAKVEAIQHWIAAGERVLMVGDGLNDAPALAAATVSLSPSSAADISQNAADIVFQGDRLAPVLEALDVARRADALVRGNFAIALGYNILAVPLAMAGFVTPLIAAAAMSSSSILVILNALRLNRQRAS